MMSVFCKLFRGRDAPIARTSGSAYSFFRGGNASSKGGRRYLPYAFTEQMMIERNKAKELELA